MKLQYEQLPIESSPTDLHVRDFENENRHDVKRRLDFITAKLADRALCDINLTIDI